MSRDYAIRYSVQPLEDAPEPGHFRATVEIPETRLWLCGIELYATTEGDLEYSLRRLVHHFTDYIEHPRGCKLN